MRVDKDTKMADLAAVKDYLTQESTDNLKEAAESQFGSPWSLDLGTFFACTEGDFSHVGIDTSNPAEMTAIQYYWMEAFKDMAESLIKTMERMVVPQSADAKTASAACMHMTFRESVLVFCRSYFGLHSFKEVESLTIDDLLLAKKDSYNTGIFEKGMAEIQQQKIKAKK